VATKTKSYGFQLQYDADGTPPFTALTDIISCTPPVLERADIKISNLDSASSAHEYIPGWTEGGAVPFMGYFTKAQFNTLLGFLTAGTEYFWRAVPALISGESTNSHVAFKGYVRKIGIDEVNIDDDGKITCPFEVKVTGLPTFVSGA
jgi:hypothetical protein